MKIQEIAIGYISIPLVTPFKTALRTVDSVNDMIVKISYSQQAVETYPDASLITIEGANHGFNADNLGSFGGSADYDSIVIPEVISYLNTYLQ